LSDPVVKLAHTKRKVIMADSKSKAVKYDPSFVGEAKKFFMCGFSQADAAVFFGVTKQTIAQWIKKYPDFAMAYRRSALIADTAVSTRLHKRAVGYEVTEKHISTEMVEGRKQIKTKTITKEIAPDVAAARYWLNNRQPKKWAEKTKHVTDDGSGNDAPMNTVAPADLIEAVRTVMSDSDNE